VLACNPVRRGRTPLALFLATLEEDWQAPVLLEQEAGEYSYPTLLQTRDGLVHLVYTWRREHRRHVCSSEAWLREAQARARDAGQAAAN